MRAKVWILLSGLPLALGLVAASPPDTRRLALGKHLAQECTTCHRIDGTDNGIPSIIGLDPDYFAGTIGFYQRGERSNQAMMSVAQSLDDEQVAALAAYYASLPKPKAVKKAP